MIKLFLIFIFLIACKADLVVKNTGLPHITLKVSTSKVSYKNLSVPQDKQSIQTYEFLEFNPQIEMMIMFLWPKDLSIEDEKEVIQIIKTSRKISSDKELYLTNLYKLKAEYIAKACDCHSYGICEDGQEMDDDVLLECDEISERQQANNMILANLTLEHEVIKEKLNIIGADNIDIGVDDDELDIGTYHVETKMLKLNKFGYRGDTAGIKFNVTPYRAKNLKAKFSFKHAGELFSGDLGVTNNQHNVIFSGELENSNGQRGLIYWEHLK